MHWMPVVLLAATLGATEPPIAEKYLHAGELAKGEQALEAALAATPKDDQLRFGLGVIRIVRGVERLGQSLYEYGAKLDATDAWDLRLPIPENPDPAPCTYAAYRRVLDEFIRDLAAAEDALAGITDDQVNLPLRLAAIRLDLDLDGKPTDRFIDILKRTMPRVQFGFLKSNPEFLVHLDRGDVAWLRAYCHLLMALIDFQLAFDNEAYFDSYADRLFSKPKLTRREPEARRDYLFALAEPARLRRCRKHVLKVAELNRETWKHIRAESDDNHEWLPNPQQKGVLGLPVQDRMIDGWLAMMGEFEALFEGQRTFRSGDNDRGPNLKAIFDDPPEKIDFMQILFAPAELPAKYLSDAKEVNLRAVFTVMGSFGDASAVAYATWFN